MQKFDRLVDAEGVQYAVDLHGPVNEAVIARQLHPGGTVGSPFLHPLELLKPDGEVYLRHNLTTWIVTDRCPIFWLRQRVA